ncbi:MAG: permease-like cell division protein FtsX [Clostridia bacterium]|nr:permease-like cell division protein FtsX [Clostridia bacterium]
MNGEKAKRSYNPLYFIGEAFRGLWRHGIMSAASVIVLASCLVLLGAFAVLIENINLNLKKLGLMNEIAVFVDYDLSPAEVDGIGAAIKELENVSDVEFISKEDGLEQMKETYSDYSALFEDIENGGDNPLADQFIVKYRDNAGVLQLESDLHAIPGVIRVNNRLDYAVKAEGLKNGVSLVFVWFFVLLFTVSVFVIFNTIRLAVEGRREEIDIMRYIGASNSFIILPFIIEGSIIGLVSAIIAFVCDSLLYRFAVSKLTSDLRMFEFLPFSRFAAVFLLGFLAIGILSGVLTSLFSIRKNLRN